MNTTVIYIIVMITILALLLSGYYFYYWAPNQSTANLYKIPLLTTETEFNESYTSTYEMSNLVINRDTLLIPKFGYGLTFKWEMNIPSRGSNDKWQNSFNHLKPIITMMDSPVISYHPKKNYLSIILKYRDNPFYAQFSEIKFHDIKLQRWSTYVLVIENRNVKLYIDNILSSTKILPSVITIYDIKSNIVLGEVNNNFLGKIKNLTLYPYPLKYEEIINI